MAENTKLEHTPGPDTRLWCTHHIGADEVHPAPDFATAQRWANWANETFAEHADTSRWVVAVWPWSTDSHAQGLARSIEGWNRPDGSQVQSERDRLADAAPELLEALREARAALHQHYVDWDGEPEDAVPLQLARARCDAALLIASPRAGEGV